MVTRCVQSCSQSAGLRCSVAPLQHSQLQLTKAHTGCAQVVRPLPGNLLLPPGWGSVKCIEAVVEPEFISGGLERCCLLNP